MNIQVEQAESLVKSKLPRALIGGFVGTVLFTLMGMFVAPKVLGQPMDVAALIAPVLGGSHTVGVIAHFVTGTIVFPIAYRMDAWCALSHTTVSWCHGSRHAIPWPGVVLRQCA